MTHLAIAAVTKGAVVAALACSAASPVHAQMHLAADKITSQQVDKTLQDTRTKIKQQQTTAPAGIVPSNQIAIDICKKNPQLPQCKL